ncbi:hypothetical protein HK405_009328, partial [Cladochytrium tenue]
SASARSLSIALPAGTVAMLDRRNSQSASSGGAPNANGWPPGDQDPTRIASDLGLAASADHSSARNDAVDDEDDAPLATVMGRWRDISNAALEAYPTGSSSDQERAQQAYPFPDEHEADQYDEQDDDLSDNTPLAAVIGMRRGQSFSAAQPNNHYAPAPPGHLSRRSVHVAGLAGFNPENSVNIGNINPGIENDDDDNHPLISYLSTTNTDGHIPRPNPRIGAPEDEVGPTLCHAKEVAGHFCTSETSNRHLEL